MAEVGKKLLVEIIEMAVCNNTEIRNRWVIEVGSVGGDCKYSFMNMYG